MGNLAKINIHISSGSVTEIAADTILVPAHPGRTGHGGVFGNVKHAGARAGCEALSNWHSLAIEDAPLGSVMRVSAGGGSSNFLSHVVTICDLAHGKDYNFAVVAAAVTTALEEMHKAGLQVVNIPMMGTGQMGWLTPEQSARAMMIGIDRFAKQYPEADLTINFCMMTSERADTMRQVLEQPHLYTDIRNEIILKEKSQATPPGAEFIFYERNDQLSMQLRSMQKRSSVSRRG